MAGVGSSGVINKKSPQVGALDLRGKLAHGIRPRSASRDGSRAQIDMATAPSTTTTTEASVEAQVFWLRFQKEIAAALIIAVLAMIGYAGYRFYASQRDSKAAELLGAAKTPEEFQAVITRYAGTPAGASAHLLLAEKQRAEKKFTDSNASLQAFIDKNPEHEFAPTAQLMMAANLEDMGKTDEALALFQQIAAKYPTSYSAPLALISQVPILKAKNRTDDARRVCEDILTKYRMPGQPAEAGQDNRTETVWAAEAMRNLRELRPSEPPKPATPSAGAPGVPPMIAAPSAAPAAAPQPSTGAPTPKK